MSPSPTVGRAAWSFALGGLVGLPPALWWLSARAVDAAPSVAREAADGRVSVRDPLSVPASPGRRAAPASSVAEEVEGIRARLEAGEAGDRPFAALRRLGAIGTPQALDLLFEQLFQDPEAFGAELIWGLLHDVDDPRVYELARMQFDRALTEGRSGARYTSGYLRLIASHGGAEGADLVLSQVFAEGRVRSAEAARVVGHLEDRSHADAYLGAVTTPGMDGARALAKGLAEWRDPYVTEELFAIGRSRNASPELRRSVLHALGYSARSAADVDAVITHYWSTALDDETVSVAMGGLRGLQENPWVDRDAVGSRAAEVLNHVLGSEHWRYGLAFISSYPDWRTPQTKQALEALLSGLEDPTDRARVTAELVSFP